MRIFNGTSSLLTLPLTGNQKLEILPKSVSVEFMGSTDFLKMVVNSLSSDEIAIVVSGPYELSSCANIPTATSYVVQTLDEAIIRFGLNKKSEPETTHECNCPKCKEDAEKVDSEVEEKPFTEIPTNPEPEQPTVVEEEKEEEPVVEETDTEEVREEEPKPVKKNKKKAKK